MKTFAQIIAEMDLSPIKQDEPSFGDILRAEQGNEKIEQLSEERWMTNDDNKKWKAMEGKNRRFHIAQAKDHYIQHSKHQRIHGQIQELLRSSKGGVGVFSSADKDMLKDAAQYHGEMSKIHDRWSDKHYKQADKLMGD